MANTWNPDITTSAGSTLAIGASVVTTAVATADLTYAVIGEVTEIGQYGRVYEIIKFISLANRRTRKFKGSFDDGTIAIKLGLDIGDAGQIQAKVALTDDHDYNFRIQYNDSSNGALITHTTSATTAASSAVITVASGPTDVFPGMLFHDTTAPSAVAAGTFVLSVDTSAHTITLNTPLIGPGAGSGDTITFTPQPTTEFFQAKVTRFPRTVGGPNNVLMGELEVAIDTDILSLAAT